MSKQFYKHTAFRSDALELIDVMNVIVDEYIEQGYRLTVRQLYYQLVARAVIENTERSYKRVTGIVNDARLCGMMDWDAIEDRTREFIKRSRWESGAEILRSVAEQFHMDRWVGQVKRVFVIVEKEALAGVLERVCRTWDVPLLAARGYPSGTVLREFAISDLRDAIDQEQVPYILHLGDHDPSGIDMTRDLRERIEMFAPTRKQVILKRIALNMEQIDEQKPPPNPAKVTDSRFRGYEQEFGTESWELDALKPEYLASLVQRHIQGVIRQREWDERTSEIVAIKARLQELSDNFE